jgi:hypothetical protein
MLFINSNIMFSFYLTDSASSKCDNSIRQLKRTKIRLEKLNADTDGNYFIWKDVQLVLTS